MCKLFGIVEIENQRNAEMFAKKAIPYITKTDNHGLGIMRLGENGVHIQRWLEPPTIVRKKSSPHLLPYEKGLKHQQNEAGKPSRDLYAIAIHGRFATCAKSLQNTHPFYRNGTALMHNGIISNCEKFPNVLSTCDSEALLTQYLQHEVEANNIRLTDALTGVGGYYAAIVFNNSGVIDVWRDETATLFLAHVRGVGVVFATTAEIITSTARKCKAYITGTDEILPYTVIRWHNGRLVSVGEFEAIKPFEVINAYKPDVVSETQAIINKEIAEWEKEMAEKDRQEEEAWKDRAKLCDLCEYPLNKHIVDMYNGEKILTCPLSDEEMQDQEKLDRMMGGKAFKYKHKERKYHGN